MPGGVTYAPPIRHAERSLRRAAAVDHAALRWHRSAAGLSKIIGDHLEIVPVGVARQRQGGSPASG